MICPMSVARTPPLRPKITPKMPPRSALPTRKSTIRPKMLQRCPAVSSALRALGLAAPSAITTGARRLQRTARMMAGMTSASAAPKRRMPVTNAATNKGPALDQPRASDSAAEGFRPRSCSSTVYVTSPWTM